MQYFCWLVGPIVCSVAFKVPWFCIAFACKCKFQRLLLMPPTPQHSSGFYVRLVHASTGILKFRRFTPSFRTSCKKNACAAGGWIFAFLYDQPDHNEATHLLIAPTFTWNHIYCVSECWTSILFRKTDALVISWSCRMWQYVDGFDTIIANTSVLLTTWGRIFKPWLRVGRSLQVFIRMTL